VRDQGKEIAIGATTGQHVVENDPLIRAKLPLLAKVMPYVGHGATRARGTVGGSIANGDPAAEIVLVAATLGATLAWRDGGRSSEVAVSEFFIGPMVTALPLTACLTEARFPVWTELRIGVGFHEVNARQSDFAFVSAAAQVALDADGRCARAAIGIGAAAAVPLRLDAVAESLKGQRFDRNKVDETVKAALADVETMADLHASAEYRRRVAATLAVRAIADAFANAGRRA
jgi:CO/xanthine dehydrogenase FAD-binding subunit